MAKKQKRETVNAENKSPIALSFGLLRRYGFAKQLREQGYRIRRGGVKKLKAYDADNDRLSALCIRGVITEKDRDRARRRLAKRVLEEIQ
jgi:hypothetical protein